MDKEVLKFTPNGSIRVPSSKSYSHRYLISAFIYNRPVTINNVNLCDDVVTTIDCLRTLGGVFETNKTTVKFIKRETKSGPIVMDVRESVSSLRMLFPMAIYLYKDVKFVGKTSLFSRPMGVYKEILEKQKIPYELGEGFIHVKGNLKPEEFEVKANISSQFISGLLLFNVLAGSKKKLKVIPPIESKFYIVMTLNVLEELGFIYENKNNVYRYLGKVKSNATAFDTEVDYSLLANFAVLATLKGSVELFINSISSLQGDSIILDFLSTIGAYIKYKDNAIVVTHHNLIPFDVNISDCIDLGPTLFALASLIPGRTHFSGIKRLQYKESNRITSMVNELKKTGVDIEVEENDLYIKGKSTISGDFEFETYNDHRIAMALTILGMNIDGKVIIKGAECVKKSYPNFYEDLESLKG